jgi:glycosyltransferase involved in cell wall biosynthesis
VLTCTYNRAHTLGRVYASLCLQTSREFEWLVVDDGSADGTAGLVRAWRDRAPFPVRYLWQPNQGKHAAFNRGAELARGELVLGLDSDDALLPRALERLLAHWRAIPAGRRAGFAGVTGLCLDAGGRVVGDPFPRPVLDSDASELVRRYGVRGEKCGFVRADLLRRHPFPEPPGVRFVPESVVWIAIGAHYRTRYVNQPLRVYFPGGDQLTAGGLQPGHPAGLALWHRAVLEHEWRWLARDPAGILRSAANYARFSLDAGQGPAALLRRPAGAVPRLLALAGLAPGWLLARRDRPRLAG